MATDEADRFVASGAQHREEEPTDHGDDEDADDLVSLNYLLRPFLITVIFAKNTIFITNEGARPFSCN